MLGFVLVIWSITPIYNMVMIALDSHADVFSGQVWPEHPSLENFRVVVTEDFWYLWHFWRQFGNSFFVGLMTTFAAQATLALSDSRSQDALRALRVLDDLERVAAAMRDTVVNRVSSASLMLHSVLQAELPESLHDRLWKVIEELDEAVAAVRSALFPR